MSVCSDHKILFYIVLISHNEANHLGLFVLALGLYPIDQQHQQAYNLLVPFFSLFDFLPKFSKLQAEKAGKQIDICILYNKSLYDSMR